MILNTLTFDILHVNFIYDASYLIVFTRQSSRKFSALSIYPIFCLLNLTWIKFIKFFFLHVLFTKSHKLSTMIILNHFRMSPLYKFNVYKELYTVYVVGKISSYVLTSIQPIKDLSFCWTVLTMVLV